MLKQIAKVINDDIFKRLKEKGITVFLVGSGQQNKTGIRDSIRKELIGHRYINWLDVYYPEELFEELLRIGSSYDLLSLENLLARSVHTVVIILESPGAIAELGAFANHRLLRDRLVVVVDKKYKKAKNFIMLGPIRYLAKKTKSIVIYHNLRDPDIAELSSQIRQAVKRLSSGVEIDVSVANPIEAQHFILFAIYAMEPVRKKSLAEMIRAIELKPQEKIRTIIIASAINILLNQQEVILQDGKYRLAKEGLERIRLLLKMEPEGPKIQKLLDKLRVDILNSTLRDKKFVWKKEGAA